VRYTALSIGYNVAVAVFGGYAPMAPSYYLIAAATITFLVVLRIPETAFEPLR
jgi:MFS transporter, MHS family, proline/betaine transporter